MCVFSRSVVSDSLRPQGPGLTEDIYGGGVCVCVYLVAQSCPTLCDSIGCSPSGPSVHGILQARILEWVSMPSSRGSS